LNDEIKKKSIEKKEKKNCVPIAFYVNENSVSPTF
jgi:hypothetical protein